MNADIGSAPVAADLKRFLQQEIFGTLSTHPGENSGDLVGLTWPGLKVSHGQRSSASPALWRMLTLLSNRAAEFASIRRLPGARKPPSR
jgi:hypothetical protein